MEDQREIGHGGVPWPHRDEDHGGLRGEHHRYDARVGHTPGPSPRGAAEEESRGQRESKGSSHAVVGEEGSKAQGSHHGQRGGCKGHRGDREDHRGGQEDHRGGPECPGDDRGDGGPQKSQKGCLGGGSLGQGGRGGKEEEGSREESGPRREEDAPGPGGQEEAGKPQGEADAKGVCWATGGGQGPSEVAGPARYPRAGGHGSEDAVCQADGEEEARVSDACREQCAEEGPREGPGRASGEKDVGGSYERSSHPMPGGRDQGPFRGSDDQRDHQGASHATTAEDNAGAGFRVRGAKEGAEDQGIRWVGAGFVVADATSRSCSATIANATQGTIAGDMVRGYSPSGQGRQREQRMWSEPLTRWMSFLFRGCFAG